MLPISGPYGTFNQELVLIHLDSNAIDFFSWIRNPVLFLINNWLKNGVSQYVIYVIYLKGCVILLGLLKLTFVVRLFPPVHHYTIDSINILLVNYLNF